jgi:hypothetical protein
MKSGDLTEQRPSDHAFPGKIEQAAPVEREICNPNSQTQN